MQTVTRHRPERTQLLPQFRKGAAERVAMKVASPWWGEHRSRYHFAAKFCIGKRILDVACGTGYGAHILLDAGADAVTGVDISPEAITEAASVDRAHYMLCQTDATRLPFRDGSFDVVCSFETIEHLQDDVGFLAELRRVLRPQGKLMLSTPNALHSQPVDGIPRNPFHVREYEPQELQTLLSGFFEDVTLLGQKVDPRFGLCPLWDHPESLPGGASTRIRIMWWRLKHRLPFAIKDRITRLLYNRPFYPGEYDFFFRPEDTDTAHVLVAVCSPRT